MCRPAQIFSSVSWKTQYICLSYGLWLELTDFNRSAIGTLCLVTIGTLYFRPLHKTISFSYVAILISCQPRLKKPYHKQLGISGNWSMWQPLDIKQLDFIWLRLPLYQFQKNWLLGVFQKEIFFQKWGKKYTSCGLSRMVICHYKWFYPVAYYTGFFFA